MIQYQLALLLITGDTEFKEYMYIVGKMMQGPVWV